MDATVVSENGSFHLNGVANLVITYLMFGAGCFFFKHNRTVVFSVP
jgi:hypothetical protein